MADRALIVNADDFGLSAGRERGRRAHTRGGHPDQRQPDGPPARRRSRPPPTPAPRRRSGWGCTSTSASGSGGTGRGQPCTRSCRSTSDPQAVEAEVRGQLARFRALTGRDPTHLDSHQHVHNWESVTEVFQRLATQLGVPLRHHIGGVAYCGDLYGHDEHGLPIPEAITPAALMRDHREPGPGCDRAGLPPGHRRRHRVAVRPRARAGGGGPVRSRRRARRCGARASRCDRSLTLRQMEPAPAKVPASWNTRDSLCGSPACRAPARARSPAWWPAACARWASSGSRCSTATSSARACAGTSASRARTAPRTSAGSPSCRSS